MVCVDIDGTLTNDQKEISPKTKIEIQRVMVNYEVEFVLVSARTPVALHLVSDQLELTHPILIGINGGLVVQVDSNSGRHDVLFSKTISSQDCRKMIDYAEENGIYLAAFCFDEWFTDHADYWADREAKNNGIPYKIMSWSEMKENTISPHKLMIRSDDIKKLDAMYEFLKLANLESVFIHRMSGTLIEPTPSNVNKETAIRLVCEKMNIDSSQVLAFGDGHNDIHMLEFAGVGVAMGNAPDSVKEKADEITASNNEDGIALVLEKYFV